MKACVIHGQHKLVVAGAREACTGAALGSGRLGAGGICGSDFTTIMLAVSAPL